MRGLVIFLIFGTVFMVLGVTVLLPSIDVVSAQLEESQAEPVPATFTEDAVVLRSMRNTSEYTAPEGRFATFDMTYDDVSRLWHGIAATGEDPRPTVILLHGSNRNGASMLDMWQATARDRNLNLIAPDARDLRGWRRDHDGEGFIRALVQNAATAMPIDPDHIYIFGHSAGARAAIEFANQSDLNIRAVAVHGGGYPLRIMREATAPTPIRMYLGDNDHVLSVEEARTMGARLAELGHPTDLMVIGDHTHWYYDIGPRLSFEVVDWFAEVSQPVQQASVRD